MTQATLYIGDTRQVLRALPDASVDAIVTSPPYFHLRSYLPPGTPGKDLEFGQEDTPGEYLENLLALMDGMWRVLKYDGTFWVNLGDSHAGSGGSGGDYNDGGLREGQARWQGIGRSAREVAAKVPWRGKGAGFPLDQSVCWLPELFGASLAYGRNMLTGAEHHQWVTRPPVTWCKPNPSAGALTRRFRSATELWIYGGKHQHHYFDLDSVREPPISDEQWTTTKTDDAHAEMVGRRTRSKRSAAHQGKSDRKTVRPVNPNGVPPKNWWVVASDPYHGAHFAVFPPELVTRPIICGCPLGGVVLDPFAGSGTTLAVATGHGRDAIGIDLDSRNAELALERVGPMLLTVEDRRPARDGAA